MQAFKFVSWNVNGIRAVYKKGFVNILRNFGADFFCLQETKAWKEQLDEQLINIEGYKSYWFSAKKKGYSSLAVYVRHKPLQIIDGIGIEKFDCEGRVQILEYDKFILVNCYFPNTQYGLARLDYKLEFGDALIKRLKDFSHKTQIICGDYNVAHKEIDLKNPKANQNNPGFSPPEREWMTKFLGLGYVDTFRLFNQEPEQYTWWTYRLGARARNIGWRIDYFCVDKSSVGCVKSARIHQDIMGSDHCPVSVEVEV